MRRVTIIVNVPDVSRILERVWRHFRWDPRISSDFQEFPRLHCENSGAFLIKTEVYGARESDAYRIL